MKFTIFLVLLLVPIHALSENVTDTKNSKEDEEVTKWLATGGRLLTGEQKTASFINQIVNNKSNEILGEWIKELDGKMKIDFSLNALGGNNGKTNLSMFYLRPLYESERNLIFSQMSIFDKEQRYIGNFGLGFRNFSYDQMVGFNIFYDHDFSRYHNRYGFGLEYRKKNLKFIGNTYFSASKWRESKDFVDYYEKPADGWDISTEYYSPQYPEFTSSFGYEKYYGHDVALFGKDNRQANPYAFNFGVKWFPTPFFGLEAKEKIGKRNKHEEEIKLSLNLGIDELFTGKMHANDLASNTSLLGGRYDFVSRNNNIVLQYQKMEVIRLKLPTEISGFEGEKKTFHISVNSKYGFKSVQWESPSFFVDGGKLLCNNLSCIVVLPKWNDDRENYWLLQAVAYDFHNNASKKVSMPIYLLSPQVSAEKSNVTVSKNEILADGASQSYLQINLRSDSGNPITGMSGKLNVISSFTPSKDVIFPGRGKKIKSDIQEPIVGEVKEQADGVYIVPITAGNSSGEMKITVNILHKTFETSIRFLDTLAYLNNISIRLSKDTIIGDGHDSSTIYIEVNDENNNGVTQHGLSVVPKPLTGLESDAITINKIKEISLGKYEADITSTTKYRGDIQLTLYINGKPTNKNVVLKVVDIPSVMISGKPVVGEKLTAISSCKDLCTFQWIIEDKPESERFVKIEGATNEFYVIKKEDQKKKIKVILGGEYE